MAGFEVKKGRVCPSQSGGLLRGKSQFAGRKLPAIKQEVSDVKLFGQKHRFLASISTFKAVTVTVVTM